MKNSGAGPGGPQLWVIAGPNGVGKTRYASQHIERVTGSRRFVNLDEIARGLSPFDRDAERVRAARIVLALLDEFVAGKSTNGNPVLTLETTLSGRTYLRVLKKAGEKDIKVHLLYFAVREVETSIARVRRRVSEGGHDVPVEDQMRRFGRSAENFSEYAELADEWQIFDNSGPEPLTLAEGRKGCCSHIENDLGALPETLASALRAFPACG